MSRSFFPTHTHIYIHTQSQHCAQDDTTQNCSITQKCHNITSNSRCLDLSDQDTHKHTHKHTHTHTYTHTHHTHIHIHIYVYTHTHTVDIVQKIIQHKTAKLLNCGDPYCRSYTHTKRALYVHYTPKELYSYIHTPKEFCACTKLPNWSTVETHTAGPTHKRALEKTSKEPHTYIRTTKKINTHQKLVNCGDSYMYCKEHTHTKRALHTHRAQRTH